MKKIPVFGTQTLNSVSNLKKLILSIDYPVETLSIVVNNENFDILNDIKNFTDNLNSELIERVDISWHPTNLGCPASWNYHFKSYPYADFFIKIDDDIELAPGDLKRIVENLSDNGIVFYSTNTKYAGFLITNETLMKVGLFDENMYPCNYEDDDYQIRTYMLGIKQICLPEISKHNSSGSSRNLKDSENEHLLLSDCLSNSEYGTIEYFNRKWGNNYPNNYPTPFNLYFGDVPHYYSFYDFKSRKNKIFRCNYTK